MVAMLAGLPDVTLHVSRFRVVAIGLHEDGLAQFTLGPMLEAADLLADARVDVILWSGTSAGWLGTAADHELARAIRERTGIPATTSVLALLELLARDRVTDVGLVTPYTGDVQQRIVATFAAEGVTVAAERHLDLAENWSFSTVPEDRLRRMAAEVHRDGTRNVVTFCTNLRAAHLASALEDDRDLTLYDTVATGLWGALTLAGEDASRVRGWGRLFGAG